VQPFIKELINLQLQLREKVGKKKKEMNFCETDKDLLSKVSGKVSEKFENIYGLVCKEERECACDEILSSLVAELKTENAELSEEAIKKAFYDLEAEFVRKKILKEEKRPDGRGLSDIRPLECKVGVLPRTHGSAIFTRGQTQSLAVVTLGTSSDEQFIEALEGETSKHFMLHYSFPPFSVGEVKMVRGPSRRDIGHGALAEKALFAVIPTKEVFPYTIRVVSEILESNGSSSMASACAASLSLMDAGVPIREPVGGIAIGLVTDADSYKILTDIAGVEDHYGDMDFKVTGTKNGITAIQLDIKIEGITFPIIEEVLRAAKEARTVILNKMQEAIALPRQSLSEYAPKIKLFEVPADKIGVIIGPGGKTIKAIQRQNNVTINIDDATSVVSVAAETDEGLQRAVNQINNLIREVEVGDIYDAKVEKIVNFGAFCEIAPGKSGLLHVSEISDEFVKDVAEFLKEGDVIRVKVIGIDPQGKIRLSLKQAK
jgi:polyribonucleotide nucleotidyltransferase